MLCMEHERLHATCPVYLIARHPQDITRTSVDTGATSGVRPGRTYVQPFQMKQLTYVGDIVDFCRKTKFAQILVRIELPYFSKTKSTDLVTMRMKNIAGKVGVASATVDPTSAARACGRRCALARFQTDGVLPIQLPGLP